MEMNERMSKRLGLLGVVVLVAIGVLVACGSNYNSSSDGLLLVGSQGSGLIETFSFSLNSGHALALANTPVDTSSQTCVLGGAPASMVMDPAGVYAYTIINEDPSCNTQTFTSVTGILAFKVNSSGTLTQVGPLLTDSRCVPPNVDPLHCASSLAMDSAGKFLFVTESSEVDVFAIGSGASLTPVAGTFNFNNAIGFKPPIFVAVAPTPTVFPAIGINGVQNSVCSAPGTPPPTAEYLYAVDSANYVVWEFSVDTTTGALGNLPGASQVPYVATGQVPAGIAVDPCDRFVYVSDSNTAQVSAYTICTVVIPQGPCQLADGSLHSVAGSPFSLSAGGTAYPGPLVVDPYGNYLYVLNTGSNTISPFKIASSGSIASLTPATVATGVGPVSIVIRADDNWMFVANRGNGTQGGTSVSQYSVVPATGAINAAAPIQTDNYPVGLAVK
jgi:6-phosphogluconolactonase (cycloisomerase 2 family)